MSGKPGKIVTNARAGFSNHNFGIAVDYVIFEGVDENGGMGKPLWDSPDMLKAGEIAEDVGLEWGQKWKFRDTPHLQIKTGLTLAPMRQRVEEGKSLD